MAGIGISYRFASGGVEEILRPTIVVSNGRSYRKLTEIEFGRRPGEKTTGRSGQWAGGRDEKGEQETVGLYRDDVYDEGNDFEEDVEGIRRLSNGNYELKLAVPQVFFKYVIGKEGRVKKSIERDTECRLWLPSKGKEGDIGEWCNCKVSIEYGPMM